MAKDIRNLEIDRLRKENSVLKMNEYMRPHVEPMVAHIAICACLGDKQSVEMVRRMSGLLPPTLKAMWLQSIADASNGAVELTPLGRLQIVETAPPLTVVDPTTVINQGLFSR